MRVAARLSLFELPGLRSRSGTVSLAETRVAVGNRCQETALPLHNSYPIFDFMGVFSTPRTPSAGRRGVKKHASSDKTAGQRNSPRLPCVDRARKTAHKVENWIEPRGFARAAPHPPPRAEWGVKRFRYAVSRFGAPAGLMRAQPAASRTKPAPIAAGRTPPQAQRHPQARRGPNSYVPAICGGFVRRTPRWTNHGQQGRWAHLPIDP